ncbi:MAG: ATP-binding protein [Proteobacteria bacterium]|nr:MAG: ATP-binding protein [Pseudomonadota bacterium]
MSLRKTGETFNFCMTDHGPGFLPGILQQIGEPFVTSREQGTGLGLYVSQLFTQSLGGTLTVRNLTPSGAEVCLVWPSYREEHV